MRFKLTAPHNLQRLVNGVPQSMLIEKGVEVSDSMYHNFSPTPAMIPLDQQAADAQLIVVNKARESKVGAEIVGFGNEHLMIGGDLYNAPPVDP